jgi:hypothetical protein
MQVNDALAISALIFQWHGYCLVDFDAAVAIGNGESQKEKNHE